jgi:hypothetical protein
MATIQLNLPDDTERRITACAAESGFTVGEYVEALICADLEEGAYDDELARVLIERVNGSNEDRVARIHQAIR